MSDVDLHGGQDIKTLTAVTNFINWMLKTVKYQKFRFLVFSLFSFSFFDTFSILHCSLCEAFSEHRCCRICSLINQFITLMPFSPVIYSVLSIAARTQATTGCWKFYFHQVNIKKKSLKTITHTYILYCVVLGSLDCVSGHKILQDILLFL